MQLKDKCRNWCLGRDIGHLAISTAELLQGGEDWYMGWQDIPMDDRPRGNGCSPSCRW